MIENKEHNEGELDIIIAKRGKNPSARNEYNYRHHLWTADDTF